MQVWYPLADPIRVLHSPNCGYGAEEPIWRAVTWHVSEGTLDGTLAWMLDASSQVASHFVIDREGQVYSLVSPNRAAWAQGSVCRPDRGNRIVRFVWQREINPNLASWSIECIGFSRQGKAGALTDSQAEALQRVTAYLCLRGGFAADSDHIIGHFQWNSCDRWYCPGFSPGEWGDWIARTRALTLLWRGW